MNTSNTPIFRMFFISTLVPLAMYMPPKRVPSGEGIKPAIVMIPKIMIEKRLMLFFLPGSVNISAIKTRRAEAVSNSS